MWLFLWFACSSAEPEAPTISARPAPSASPPAGGPALDAIPDVPERPIFVKLPVGGMILTSGPIEVRGAAQVWEGRVSLRLLAAGGEVLDEQHVSASVAAPGRGDWAGTLTPPEGHQGPVTVQAYSSSARDGAPENVYEVPVVLR